VALCRQSDAIARKRCTFPFQPPVFFPPYFLFLRRSHYDYDSELILVFFREPISESMAHFARVIFVSSRHRGSFNELFRLAVLFLNRNRLLSRAAQ
jgi:hypothetical protein